MKTTPFPNRSSLTKFSDYKVVLKNLLGNHESRRSRVSLWKPLHPGIIIFCRKNLSVLSFCQDQPHLCCLTEKRVRVAVKSNTCRFSLDCRPRLTGIIY